MRLHGNDWAKYKFEDFIIDCGIPCNLENDVMYRCVSETSCAYFTIRTHDKLVLMYVALEHNADAKQWVKSQIERAKRLASEDLESIFQELDEDEFTSIVGKAVPQPKTLTDAGDRPSGWANQAINTKRVNLVKH
jgi:hypothetical protein